jgi:hypothetical protein
MIAHPLRPRPHASFVFLLDAEGIAHPLPHALFVAMVRGAAAAPEFAGRTLRLAEWYVRMQGDEPQTLVNEQYSYVHFDETGRLDWHRTPPADGNVLPTAAERAQMTASLFGTNDHEAHRD